VIDIHSHILPGLDDGARDWDEALQMARLAVADGIRVMVATPHLFKERTVALDKLNHKNFILQSLAKFRQKLAAQGIDLEILPGCDVPLSPEALELLHGDLLLTINDGKRYLLLELPDTSFPPALEGICFRLISEGLTPIITHPERQLIIQERPDKLARLINLGCLAQLTATSLLGGFGRRVAKVSRDLVKQGLIHLLASDAHNPDRRPPVLSPAVKKMASLVGPERAQAMVTQLPEKIIRGEPIF
jgi:protein-tyrosine phosphatase